MSTDSQISSVVTSSSPDDVAKNQEKKTLVLISSDKEEFVISESAAALSISISNIVEEGCAGKIPLPSVDGKTVAKVVEYLNYKHDQENLSVEERKKLDDDFLGKMDIDELLDMVLAANYLNIKTLLDIVCQKTADVMENKSVDWVRKKFQIENDFGPGEEEKIRQEYAWAFEGVEEDQD